MTQVYIVQHLGLGDHIICNGLIRELAKKYDRVLYPVKFHNVNNVMAMHGDMEDKLHYVPVRDDDQMTAQAQNYFGTDILPIGLFAPDTFLKTGEKFCQSFYRQAGIDYGLRWKSFHADRNELKEKTLITRYELPSEYNFVHDDPFRNLRIETSLLPDDVLSVRPNHKFSETAEHSLFDYISLLEGAAEIHCMDSSFAAMIDHLPSLRDTPKYLHRYIRKNNENPIYNNGWVILNEPG